MRTLAPLPSTTLSEVMSQTTTTSRRLLNRRSRNPQTRTGPGMTSSTMTSPSALRSLHHCSHQEREDDASRRRVSRRQSVMIRTGRPVVCSFDSQETQRHNSEKEQIRILLERPREQILADCQAGDSKTRVPGRWRQKKYSKLNEMIESQRRDIYRAHQGDERLRRDQQHEQLLAQNRDLREAREKSLSEMEEWKQFQVSTFDTILRRKLVEGSRHYPWTHKQDSGWNHLYEWFERFPRCWISTQWTIPRCQSTSVFFFHTSSR